MLENRNQTTMSRIIHDQAQKTAFFEKIHSLLWNEAGLNPEKAMEHMIFFFAYRLLDPCVKKLGLPDHCSWSHIVKIEDPCELHSVIRQAVTDFRKNSITKPFFNKHDLEKALTVKRLVEAIQNNLSDDDLNSTDILGDVFEYMLGRGISTMADDGQYFTNRLICKKAFDLAYKVRGSLRREDGSLCTFADFFCGTGGFAIEYIKGVNAHDPDVDWEKDKDKVYCLDKNASSITTTLLNCLIYTHEPFLCERILSYNSFCNSISMGSRACFPGLEVDIGLSNPPYGGDKTKGKDYKFCYKKVRKTTNGAKVIDYQVNDEIRSIGIEDDDKVSAGVQLAMATLSKNGGVQALVLPQGFFFGAANKVVELRKRLAEEYKIHYVVEFISGAFANTGTKTSMVVFQRGVGPTETIKFMDMDDNMLAEVTLEQMRKKKYSLNYKTYLEQELEEYEGFEWKRLGDVLMFASKKLSLKSSDGKSSGRYPFYTCAQKHMYVDVCEFTETAVIVNRGGLMNVRMDKGFSISHDDIHVLIAKPNVSTETTVKYVGYYMMSNMNQLQNGMNGTTLQHLNKSYLNDFKIPLPSMEKQQEIVSAIEPWASLAQAEEEALKILEKGIMAEIALMRYGAPRVRLGDVCKVSAGEYITKATSKPGIYPVYGGGNAGPGISRFNRENTFVIAKDGVSAKCVRYVTGKFFLNHHGWTFKVKDICHMEYVGYWLLANEREIYKLADGTAQKGISMERFYDIQIPIPSLGKQQGLQEAFDEVRHKHKLIARYKAKADEAIKKYIPGADQQEEEEAGPSMNEHVQPVVQEPSSSSSASVASKSSVKELKEQCKSLGIKGYSTKKKDELLKMIQEHQAK